MSREQTLKTALVAFIAVAYIVAFFPLHRALGHGVTALSTLPVLLAVWFFEMRVGVLAAVLTIPVNTLLLSQVGITPLEAWFYRGGMLGFSVITFVAIILGQAKDLSERLKQELAERRNAEAALRESEQQYRTLVNHQGEGVAIVDPNEIITFANPAAHAVFGVPLGNLVGKNLKEFLDPVNLALVYSQTEQRRAGRSSVYELEITRPDGARRRLLLTATPQFDSQGTFAGAFAIFRDITERKEMEDKLRHEVEKMNALHMIDQAMATLDLQACLRVIVQRARALFDTDMVAILLQEGNFLRLVAEEGLENSQTEILVPIDRGLTGWSYSSRQSVLVPDVRNDERYLIFDNRTRAEMVAPLIAQDECIGVLNAESARLNAFTFADLEMLESLATRAATAIRNARLHAAEQSERRFAETLRDVGYALTSKLDPDAVLDQLLDLVARVVPYDTASVLFVENEMVCIKRQRGFEQFGQAQEAADFHARLKDLPSLAKAAETGRPHIVPDTRSDPDWVRLELGDHILSCIVAPISVRGQLLGFLSLDKATPNFYDAETADRLAIFAAQAGLALENARLYAEQRRLAITDELTGLFNRRYWIELAEREYARARRRQSPLSVTMIDMNGFKKINDTYGHAMGDEVLRRAAETIKSSVRSVDMAARLGGDEFVVLLPDCGISDVRKVTARLEQQIKELRVPVPDGKIGLSFSVGSATLDPAAEETLDSLLIRADAKMYRTKAQSNGQSHKFKSRRNISGGNGHSPGDEQVAGIAVELFQPYRATRNA